MPETPPQLSNRILSACRGLFFIKVGDLVESQQLLTEDEKRAYVERIEKKATDENITIKYAAQKLGCKVWAFYKYKSELRKVDADRCRSETADGKNGAVEKHGQDMPIALKVNVSPDVMSYLEKEAEGYATDADLVAQLLLHDCVRGKIKSQDSK